MIYSGLNFLVFDDNLTRFLGGKKYFSLEGKQTQQVTKFLVHPLLLPMCNSFVLVHAEKLF